MTHREIHLIIPDRTLVKTMINAIVKGNDDCPEEFYLMSIERVRSLKDEDIFLSYPIILVAWLYASLCNWCC